METVPKKCTPIKPYNKLHNKQLEAIRDMNVKEIINFLHNSFAHGLRAVPFAGLVTISSMILGQPCLGS